jgi:GH18 family chitinase
MIAQIALIIALVTQSCEGVAGSRSVTGSVTGVTGVVGVTGWPSIHTYQYSLHPYERTQTYMITEKGSDSLTHVVYGFLPHWRGAYTSEIRTDLISHLAWFGIELDMEGQVEERNGWPEDWQGLKDNVQLSGTRFDLVVTCFDWSGNKVHYLLSDSTSRGQAIVTILAESAGCDGVNIDFERPGADDRELFAGFIEELADSLHARDMTLSVDVTAVNWGDRIDEARIAKAVDYVFIMGYDFHYSGSSQSGPVAPLAGETYNVTRSVESYVEKSGLPDKIVLGVPYYGYDWATSDTVPYSSTKGTGTAYVYSSAATRAVENGRQWHQETSTPWYHYQSGSDTRQCWFDDDVSLSLKYDLARNKKLAGIGMWALSYDYGRDELWNLLARKFSSVGENPENRLPSLLPTAQVTNRRELIRYLRQNPELEIFDPSGRKLSKPRPGILLVRSNGKTSKIIVVK